MFRSVILAFGASSLLACSTVIENPPVHPEDANGPTWLDGSPATLPYDAGPIVDAAIGDAADAYVAASHCTLDQQGCGSWLGYVCPPDYTPPPESHCIKLGTDAELPIWCCYGTKVP